MLFRTIKTKEYFPNVFAEETALSAEELANQARQLQQTIDFFTIENASQKDEPTRTRQNTRSNEETSKQERQASGSQTVNAAADSAFDEVPGDIPPDADGYEGEFERY